MSESSQCFILSSLLKMVRANALFNAVKKIYGLNTYLLRLSAPSPPPPPVPIPALFPRLPSPTHQNGQQQSIQNTEKVQSPTTETTPGLPVNSIRMCEVDIQETARFVRDFVTTGLIPWMEKCVVDWNEAVRLPVYSNGLLTNVIPI